LSCKIEGDWEEKKDHRGQEPRSAELRRRGDRPSGGIDVRGKGDHSQGEPWQNFDAIDVVVVLRYTTARAGRLGGEERTCGREVTKSFHPETEKRKMLQSQGGKDVWRSQHLKYLWLPGEAESGKNKKAAVRRISVSFEEFGKKGWTRKYRGGDQERETVC